MDFSFANSRNTKFVLLPNLIFFVDMLEDMHDYGVYNDVVDKPLMKRSWRTPILKSMNKDTKIINISLEI